MTDELFLPPIRRVPIASVRELDGNPNRMDQAEARALAALIRSRGFFQPLLVRELPDDAAGEAYELVDGAHRLAALRTMLDVSRIPAVVLPADTPEREVRAIRIAMNKLRGGLDLAAVGSELARIVEAGASLADASTSTGFAEDEIADLLRTGQPSVDDALAEAEAMGAAELDDPAPARSSWDLTIPFETKAARAKALKEIKRLAGKGGKLSDGLARALFDD